MKRILVPIAILALVAAGCGGGGDEELAPTPPQATGDGRPSPEETTPQGAEAQCSPSGTELEVEAENTEFDTECLAAPADQAFTLEFKNRDEGIPHNVAIESEDEVLFRGEIFQGDAEETYQVEPISAGTYEFFCEVHPVQMRGAFVVE